ncbi:MAG: hypothetical protein V4675_04120 [Verrucomicrobiota bacterium]
MTETFDQTNTHRLGDAVHGDAACSLRGRAMGDHLRDLAVSDVVTPYRVPLWHPHRQPEEALWLGAAARTLVTVLMTRLRLNPYDGRQTAFIDAGMALLIPL